MPALLHVFLVLLLLCADSASAKAPGKSTEALAEDDETFPLLDAPWETGPGPCIALQVKANGAPAAGAHVVTDCRAGSSHAQAANR